MAKEKTFKTVKTALTEQKMVCMIKNNGLLHEYYNRFQRKYQEETSAVISEF